MVQSSVKCAKILLFYIASFSKCGKSFFWLELGSSWTNVFMSGVCQVNKVFWWLSWGWVLLSVLCITVTIKFIRRVEVEISILLSVEHVEFSKSFINYICWTECSQGVSWRTPHQVCDWGCRIYQRKGVPQQGPGCRGPWSRREEARPLPRWGCRAQWRRCAPLQSPLAHQGDSVKS